MSAYINKLSNEYLLPLRDADKHLDMTVTKQDVKSGVCKDPQCCAFALACMRSDPRVEAAFFFRTTAWLMYDNELVRYNLPQSVRQAIVLYDRTGKLPTGAYSFSPAIYKATETAKQRAKRAAARKAKKSGKKVSTVVRKASKKNYNVGVRKLTY